jgi:hypothetical protein
MFIELRFFNKKLIEKLKLFSTGIILLWLFLQSPLKPIIFGL